MKNISDEKPSYDLVGRLMASAQFVNDKDIKDKSILDIGCGFGWCELNFLNRGVRQMTGMEITEDDLKTARKSVRNKKIYFCVGSANKLPFLNKSFDTVVSWEVIEHIPKNTENQMFSEISRVLKPMGVFYLSTPHSSFFSNILDPAWWLIGHRHYTQEQLVEYAKKNGFEVKDIKIKGRLWTLFSILNMYFSKWILRRTSLYKNIFTKNEHKEYMNINGFVNIFIKLEKII